MINVIQGVLKRVGGFANNNLYVSIAIILLVSAFAGVGITKIEFQSDLSKLDPQDLPIIVLNNKVSDKFSTGDSTLILIELEPREESLVSDIRDPEVISFILELTENLRDEKLVNSVTSPSDFFETTPESLRESKETIDSVPGGDGFFGEGYDWTILLVESDVGNDEAKIRQLNEKIEELVLESGKPIGVKATVTGTPSLIAIMFNFLINDSMFTLIAAAVMIFLLLIIIERSLKKSFMIIIPLLFGLEWTLGTLGWFNIPITIATAGLSAMLLGLGVEYSIFLFSRYSEELERMDSKKAIEKALATTGASTVSSGMTTLIGFGALTLSAFPVLADMGASLAMGIGFILCSVMFTSPVIIQLEQKFSQAPLRNGKRKKGRALLKNLFESYGKFLSRAPFLIVIVMVFLSGLMFVGIGIINNQDIDFDTVLPQGLDQLDAYKTIQNERGQTEDIILFVEIVPSDYSTVSDIREREIAQYVDILTQKSEDLAYIEEVSSYTKMEKQFNDGKLFSSFSDRREFFNLDNSATFNFMTRDYSDTIITLDFNEDVAQNRLEVVRQAREMVRYTESLEGVSVSLVGNLAVQEELDEIQGPDSSYTAMIAMAGVFILLLILSRSIKYTILPLFTVIGAIIWTLGLVGFTGVPFNSITSSVLSMTIGIGIDFGLQLSMRYRQERRELKKKEAMTNTLKHTLYPMTITVIAALIGFRAMSLGNLTMMADLGTTMGYSIVASMIFAVTMVASLILIFDRSKD